MNQLPHLSSIFDHLKRGCHIGPEDEPEFSTLASPTFEEYQAYFAALGFELVRHEREFFYFEPENPEAIPDTLPRITAAPKAVSEVDALYFVQPHNGKIILRKRHRMSVKRFGATTPA